MTSIVGSWKIFGYPEPNRRTEPKNCRFSGSVRSRTDNAIFFKYCTVYIKFGEKFLVFEKIIVMIV